MTATADLPTVTESVRTALRNGMAAGYPPSAEQVARLVAFSSGHLRRLLRAEGTTLGAIRDELMRDEAVAFLIRGEGVEATSRRLGFAEPSSFRRAFKRWTGKTPASYLED